MALRHVYENGLYKVSVVSFFTLFHSLRRAAFFSITGALVDFNGSCGMTCI
jgi:hypothetical protein